MQARQTADTDAFMDAVDECEQADKHMILQVWSSKREELRGMPPCLWSLLCTDRRRQ